MTSLISLNSSSFPYLNRTQNELNVYHKLIQDYQTTNQDYGTTLISTIINNESSHFLILLKETKLMTEDAEYLTKYHPILESKKRYQSLIHYYVTYSKIFPNYNALKEAKYFFMNIQKKQRMINVQERLENEETQKIKSSGPKLNEDGLDLFDTDIYGSIFNDTNNEDIDALFGLTSFKCKEENEDEKIGDIEKIINDIEMNSQQSDRIKQISLLPSKTIPQFSNYNSHNIYMLNNKPLSQKSIEKRLKNSKSNDKYYSISQYIKEKVAYINNINKRGLNKSLGYIRQRNTINMNNSITSLMVNRNHNNKDSSLLNLNLGNNCNQKTSIVQSILSQQKFHHQYINHSKMIFSRNIDKSMNYSKMYKSPIHHQINSPQINEENKETKLKSFKYFVSKKENNFDVVSNEGINSTMKKYNDNSQRQLGKKKTSANLNRIKDVKTLYSFKSNNNMNDKVTFYRDKSNEVKGICGRYCSNSHNGNEVQLGASSSMSCLLK